MLRVLNQLRNRALLHLYLVCLFFCVLGHCSLNQKKKQNKKGTIACAWNSVKSLQLKKATSTNIF